MDYYGVSVAKTISDAVLNDIFAQSYSSCKVGMRVNQLFHASTAKFICTDCTTPGLVFYLENELFLLSSCPPFRPFPGQKGEAGFLVVCATVGSPLGAWRLEYELMTLPARISTYGFVKKE